ncbi:hypothetical protein MRX96_027094 [Rhipicephalus microplus]
MDDFRTRLERTFTAKAFLLPSPSRPVASGSLFRSRGRPCVTSAREGLPAPHRHTGGMKGLPNSIASLHPLPRTTDTSSEAWWPRRRLAKRLTAMTRRESCTGLQRAFQDGRSVASELKEDSASVQENAVSITHARACERRMRASTTSERSRFRGLSCLGRCDTARAPALLTGRRSMAVHASGV